MTRTTRYQAATVACSVVAFVGGIVAGWLIRGIRPEAGWALRFVAFYTSAVLLGLGLLAIVALIVAAVARNLDRHDLARAQQRTRF